MLVAALKLFETPEGPVLEDFPDAAPVSDDPIALACPVSLPEAEVDLNETEKFCRDFTREITSLRPWYDRAVKDRNRSAVGVSKLSQEEIAALLCSFLSGDNPENPREEVPFDKQIRYVADDLKAYYFEAITAQPGAEKLSGDAIEKWFWEDTLAAKVLKGIKEVLSNSEDEALKQTGARALVPQKFAT